MSTFLRKLSGFFRQADRGALGWAVALPPLHARLSLLVLAGVLTLAFGTLLRGGLANFEEQVGAAGWLLNPGVQTEERISVIAIDERSLEQVGAFPWPRETMARLAEALTAAGVQLQLYDIVFADPKQGDDVLAAALANTRAVLPQVPVLGASENIRTGVLTHPLSGLACSQDASATQSYVANAAAFAAIPKGHIAPNVASDGAVRSIPAFICVDGAAYPALAVSAMLAATNSQSWAATLQTGSSLLAAEQVLHLEGYPGLSVPLDRSGNMRVSFRNSPDTYREFSAVDILNGTIDPDLLANTWVLVGYTAFGIADIVPTPYNGAAPGVELQARLLASILDASVPYTPRSAPLLLALVSLVFAGLLLLLSGARERVAGYSLPLATIVLPLVAILLHAQVLATTNIWLGWLSPAFYAVCAASLLILHGYARVRMERSRVFDNLRSYLPTDVAQEIAFALPNSAISARRQDATLLSADLRNFSAYGEARPPEESAALLHYFFVRTTEIIEKHAGRVHEFKGDSLLAIWDDSGSGPATLALRAAEEIQRALHDILPQTPPPGLEPLALGLGIEQGPVLIGSIGPAHRRSHTLLGETVTITLRIQEMTAELAQPILIGECAARHLSDQGLESQGSYLLAGLRTPHLLFAPSVPEAAKAKQDNVALKLLKGGRP